MKLFLLSVFILNSVIAIWGQGKPVSDRQDSSTSITNLISAYASNHDEMYKLFEKSQAQARSNIIAYYRSGTNQLQTKDKIVVAACLAQEDDFEAAAKLLEEYVQVYTNNVRSWMLLGSASIMIEKKERAIEAYEKAIALGNKDLFTALAGIALEVDRTDIVKKYIPEILRIKNAPSYPHRYRQDAVGILASYALKVEDEQVFLLAVDGVTVREIDKRKDILKAMDQACQKFSSPKAKEFCQKLSELEHRPK